jgi:hypothetical protein
MIFIKSNISGNRTRKSHPKSLMKTGDAEVMFLKNSISVSWEHHLPLPPLLTPLFGALLALEA